MREQNRVHALLQARAVADEMETEAGPLPLCAHVRVGQPDRRHQLTTRQLGQHPSVDPIGLAGQRRQPLHLLRVGDLDLPASALELVVDEARSVHRLNRRTDRRTMTIEPFRQAAQTVGIRWRRTDLDCRTISVEQMEVETLATEIQTGVTTLNSGLLSIAPVDKPEPATGGGPPSWHSLPFDLAGNGSQPTATVLAYVGRFDAAAFATACHRLRPLGSTKAPSSVVSWDDAPERASGVKSF